MNCRPKGRWAWYLGGLSKETPIRDKIMDSLKPWRERYSLVLLCFCAVFVCYIDRVSISIAIIPMAEEYGWTEGLQGVVLSSFYLGYMATQLLGGYLADRFGGKLILAIGVLWWSAFTVLTPLAASIGLGILLATRVLMGMGEGVTFPSIYALYGKWVPAKERARTVGLSLSGAPIGQVAALIVAPYIALWIGWQWIFYIFAALGAVWFLFWQRKVSSDPGSHPQITVEELAEISAEQPAGTAVGIAEPSLLDFARSMPVWAIVVAHFCNNWLAYVMLSWLPTYVNKGLGVSFANSGWLSMLPHLVSFVFLNVAGNLADRMVKTGMAVTRVRKICQTIAFGGIAAALFVVGEVDSAWLAMTIMCIGMAIGSLGAGGFFVNHIDIAPRHSGRLMGITNTVATIPGILGVMVSGFILESTGSWALVFQITGAVAVFGLVFYLLFASGEQRFD